MFFYNHKNTAKALLDYLNWLEPLQQKHMEEQNKTLVSFIDSLTENSRLTPQETKDALYVLHRSVVQTPKESVLVQLFSELAKQTQRLPVTTQEAVFTIVTEVDPVLYGPTVLASYFRLLFALATHNVLLREVVFKVTSLAFVLAQKDDAYFNFGVFVSSLLTACEADTTLAEAIRRSLSSCFVPTKSDKEAKIAFLLLFLLKNKPAHFVENFVRFATSRNKIIVSTLFYFLETNSGSSLSLSSLLHQLGESTKDEICPLQLEVGSLKDKLISAIVTDTVLSLSHRERLSANTFLFDVLAETSTSILSRFLSLCLESVFGRLQQKRLCLAKSTQWVVCVAAFVAVQKKLLCGSETKVCDSVLKEPIHAAANRDDSFALADVFIARSLDWCIRCQKKLTRKIKKYLRRSKTKGTDKLRLCVYNRLSLVFQTKVLANMLVALFLQVELSLNKGVSFSHSSQRKLCQLFSPKRKRLLKKIIRNSFDKKLLVSEFETTEFNNKLIKITKEGSRVSLPKAVEELLERTPVFFANGVETYKTLIA